MGNLKTLNQLNIAYNDVSGEGLYVSSSFEQPYTTQKAFINYTVVGESAGTTPIVYLEVIPDSLNFVPIGLHVKGIIMPRQLPNTLTNLAGGTQPIRFEQIAIIRPDNSTHSSFRYTPLNVASPNNITYTTPQPYSMLGNDTVDYNNITYNDSTKTFSCRLAVRGGAKMVKGTYLFI